MKTTTPPFILRYRSLIDELNDAIGARDFQRFRHLWIESRQLWPLVRREINTGVSDEETLREAHAQIESLARKLRSWQEATRERLQELRQQRQRRRQVAKSYGTLSSGSGNHITINIR